MGVTSLKGHTYQGDKEGALLSDIVAVRETGGIDYLTLTAHGDGERTHDWSAKAHVYVCKQQELGNSLEAVGMHGYKGFSCGGAFSGDRDDGAMLRVSGPLASDAWETLYNIQINNVTRIDLQITVWFDREARNLINKAHSQAKKHREAGGTQRRTETFIAGGEKGDTTYLGSRSSTQYIRIYDKWRESGDDAYKWAIRYEIEYKGDKAAQISKTLHSKEWSEAAEYIRGQVIGTLAAEGVIVPVDVLAGNYERVKVEKPTTDAETKLRWLATQVSPSIAWLCERGLRAEVLSALGLTIDHHAHQDSEALDTEAGDSVG